MRAVLLTAIGGYECLSVRDDVAVPTPGADEVLIRVAAAGVNNTDINTRLGWYAQEADDSVTWNHDAPTFPRIQGTDACGHVSPSAVASTQAESARGC